MKKTKKSKVRFIVGDPQRQASQNPCDARYENKIHQVTHTQKSGRNLGKSQTTNLPKKKNPGLVHMPMAAAVICGNPCLMALRTSHQKSDST